MLGAESADGTVDADRPGLALWLPGGASAQGTVPSGARCLPRQLGLPLSHVCRASGALEAGAPG